MAAHEEAAAGDEAWPERPVADAVGQGWRSGEWCSIPMTLVYHIDNDLGQVR